MKICAMCGKKILNSMLPFAVRMGPEMQVDVCGRCFLLVRITDFLSTEEEITNVNARRPKPHINN